MTRHIGEPCESCGVNVIPAPGSAPGTVLLDINGYVLVEVPHQDGRTQRMPVHTPERCRAVRGAS